MNVANYKKEQYQLSVVIINYKTPDLVIDCLESLISELEEVEAKVVIVDNKSNDGSCDKIERWVELHEGEIDVLLISASENSGFSGGNNLGIKALSADYYLLLNSDTIVRENSIKELLKYAKSDSSSGLVSPRLEWPDGAAQESCFKFHTPVSELISSAKTGVVTKLLKRFRVAKPVQKKPAYYDWTSFACVLVKNEVIDDVGLLDDEYFMYFEDVEYCYRVKNSNWNILNVPSAHVVHLRGGSSPLKSQAKLRRRLPKYFYESRTRYFYQLYGRVGLFFANTLWTVGWVMSCIRMRLSKTYQPNVSSKQWKDIWINFLTPLKSYTHPDNYDKT